MKGCHNCPHAAEIEAGKYSGKRWEDTPCAHCDVMKGLGFSVEFDDTRLARESRSGAGEAAGSDAKTGDEDRLPISVMQEMMVGFLNLKPELRDVVAWRYAGMKYEEIALVQGVTMACVEKRHRRAMALWPALKALFPVKVAKRRRRRGKDGRQDG